MTIAVATIGKAAARTSKKERAIEAIDIFCGIGGLTNGLRRAKIKVLAGLDNDLSCKEAYEKSNKGSEFIHKDITDYNFNELSKKYSDNSYKVLVGCAPCQPFSTHVINKNKTRDSRWELFKYFTKAVKKINPDVISVENVPGFAKANIFRDFLKLIKKMGYEYDFKVISCTDYGIPQTRKRLILLASKLGSISIPKGSSTQKKHKIKNFIGKLPKLKSGGASKKDPLHKTVKLSELNIKRIRQSKPNSTWEDWDDELKLKCHKRIMWKGYKAVYGRMDWNEPAPTLTTQFLIYSSGRFGHPEQDRTLSLREGALLQTFPKNYNFGSELFLTKTARHIGNAVPPLLAKKIGLTIKTHLNHCEDRKK